MNKLTDDEKAILYNDMLMKYRKLENSISQIRLKNYEVSESDQKLINEIQFQMKKIYSDVQKLFQ